MSYVFNPAPVATVPVVGRAERFPVHRIYCVGRNYEEHAKEMGFTGREPPFFFLKPADAAVVVEAGREATIEYPSLTKDLHHEIELVACIGTGGKNIKAADAKKHIFGYAVGLDMTRRDLQQEAKDAGRPWEIGKAFDFSAPVGQLHRAADVADIAKAAIGLQLDGVTKQEGRVDDMIWSIPETIANLSTLFTLQPGDLIFTGTPEGVGALLGGATPWRKGRQQRFFRRRLYC